MTITLPGLIEEVMSLILTTGYAVFCLHFEMVPV